MERSGIRMKQSEVLDRWTILVMKSRICPDSSGAEFDEYSAEAHVVLRLALGRPDWMPGLIMPLMRLMEANSKIWVLESAIRNGREMPLEEVGRRALEIRDHNQLRVAAKRDIDLWYGQSPDVKVNHASATP